MSEESMVGVAKLLDVGISLMLAGVKRHAIVTKVAELQAEGKTLDEITDALQDMRQESEVKAQDAIDSMG